MKIDDIDAFVAVIRNASLSQAAESLGLTQSAITRRVQSLEESLGVALLDRNTKPLKPTASGLRVYEQCRRVLREVDGLRELVAGDSTPSGVLRLGVPQSIGEVVLLDALRRLADEYPELRAQVGTGWGSHLLARLENAELDAAVVLFPPSKVFPEELRRHAPRAHGTLRGGRPRQCHPGATPARLLPPWLGAQPRWLRLPCRLCNGPWPIRAWACN